MTSVVESWSVGNLSLSVELADKRTLVFRLSHKAPYDINA